ncbi:MAG: ABC transporter substrate-binding protein [Firmicutes bacterium]|nr:ABC transporter substrate-binding protein [Bacillota bacterium]
MTRKLLSLLLAAVLSLAVSMPALAGETVHFTDSAGRSVEVPADITRIALSGGTAQMILVALAPEYFVGVASPWPKEAQAFLDEDYYNLPVIGQLYGAKDLNLEQLAALDPQIIIDVGEAKASIAEDMDDLQATLGIPTVHVDAYLDTFAQAYRTLGALLGLEARGEALAAYCETAYARAVAIAAQLEEGDRVRMLYLLGSDGLNVIAKGSFHGEIIDMLCENLAVIEGPSTKGTGDPVDMEQILLWNPDVIVFAPGSVYAQVKDDPLWNELDAIQNGRYVEAPLGPYNWMGFPPSVQRYLGLLWMGSLFYPELAGYDLYEEVAAYFELFYHTELTREQFDRLTERSML